MRKKPVCDECGSDDVLGDAFAQWDIDDQEWCLQNVFDKGAYCNECDAACELEWVEVKEEEEEDEDATS